MPNKNKCIFTLATQFSKLKIISDGNLSISEFGNCRFYDEKENLVAELGRAKIEFAGADGIKLSGMEFAGNDKKGVKKYKYQEWVLIYKRY